MKPCLTLTLVSALALLSAQPVLAQDASPGAGQGARSAPPKDAAPAQPKADIDPKINVPPVAAPPSNTNAPKAQDDSVKGKDDSVKKVPPAPSEPDKPGVRPL